MANHHVFLMSAIFVVIVSLLPSLLVPVEAKFSLSGLSTDVFSSQSLNTFRLLAEKTPFVHPQGHHLHGGHHVRCHALPRCMCVGFSPDSGTPYIQELVLPNTFSASLSISESIFLNDTEFTRLCAETQRSMQASTSSWEASLGYGASGASGW